MLAGTRYRYQPLILIGGFKRREGRIKNIYIYIVCVRARARMCGIIGSAHDQHSNTKPTVEKLEAK